MFRKGKVNMVHNFNVKSKKINDLVVKSLIVIVL